MVPQLLMFTAIGAMKSLSSAVNDDEERLFRYCACGCERQVVPPREFVSGHDGRYKSILWDRVREGRRAEEELGRRRWERPPEVR